MDDPRVQEAISRLRLDSGYGGDGGESDAKQIFHVKDDHAFLWNRRDSNILAVALNTNNREENPVQILSLTDSPIFEVERICSSLSGEIAISTF